MYVPLSERISFTCPRRLRNRISTNMKCQLEVDSSRIHANKDCSPSLLNYSPFSSLHQKRSEIIHPAVSERWLIRG